MRWLLAPSLALMAFVLPTGPVGAQAPPYRHTIVVELGGYNSTINSDNWALIEGQLSGSWGYSVADFYRFSYSGWNVPAGSSTMTLNWYDQIVTCAPIADETALLAGMIRFLRDAGWADSVVLVGHSLGGVLAIQSVMDNNDLTPFVRTVVTVDSPLGGINRALSFAANTVGDCQSLGELGRRRGLAQQWQAYYLAKLTPVLARGVNIIAVSNPDDDWVGFEAQCLCMLRGVNALLAAPGHSAVFYDPGAVSQIAQWIGPQGQ